MRLALALTLAVARPALAAVPIYDASNRSGTSYPVGKAVTGEVYRQAQSFKTGTVGYSLDSVVLKLSAASGSSGLQVSLHSDSSGKPGSSIATLVASGSPIFKPILITYTPATPLFLAANSTYWIVASADSSSSFYSWYGGSQSPLLGSDVGRATSINNAPWTVDGASGLYLKVNVVPEPGAWAAVVLSGLALWTIRRRRRGHHAGGGNDRRPDG